MKFLSAILFVGLLAFVAQGQQNLTVTGCGVKMSIPYQVQPNSYTCGSTSLSMLMAHYGVNHKPMDICEHIGHCNSGVSEEEIVKAAIYYGFKEAKIHSGEELWRKAIANKIPTIMHLNVISGKQPIIYNSGGKTPSFSGGHYIESHGLGCDSKGDPLYYICNDPGHHTFKDVEYTHASMAHAWGEKSYHFITLKTIP